jgi:tetratricopeptide (TPR) repeat protein
MVEKKNSSLALQYLENEPDVKQSMINIGSSYYLRTLGQIYLWAKNGDSALHYLKLAEIDYVNNYDPKLKRSIFREIAQCYDELLHNIPEAIYYYSQVMDISIATNDASYIANTSFALSKLYEQQGDFTQAYLFSKKSIQYQDSLRKLSEGRDIALLNVERENRKHAEESRQAAEKLANKRNIQYMAITIAIAVVFTIMLILGMFPISKLTIKMLGYFFFISLFEFIVMVIDSFLHKITHGEPLKIWLIKIVLIAMLVPFQHYLEHGLIKFLESRKLLEARTKLKLIKWRVKPKKPVPPVKEADFEENTAVL